MKKILFDVDEMRMIAMFQTDDKEEIIQGLQNAVAYIRDDDELSEAVARTLEKLKQISKEEFAELDLESYRDDLDGEDEE